MGKLTEMPQNIQERIKQAGFLHYLPWTMAAKEDSISTPIRLVVDPTCTGLNIILPIGEYR